jgi:hypothetical protein
MGIKTSFHHAFICLSLLCLSGIRLIGQTSPFDTGYTEEAALIQEHVDAYTDRSLYITKELIRFSARLQTEGLDENSIWSSVLYVELVSEDGEQEAGGKFPVYDRVAFGEMAIPGGILTGNYFLRCYTRWMRNRNPEAFCYIPLRIINPNRADLSGAFSPEGTGSILSVRPVQMDVLAVEGQSAFYKRGDTVSLEIALARTNDFRMVEGCLGVVALEAKPGAPMAIVNDRGEQQDFKISYLPDLSGATLSGSIFRRNADEPVLPGTRVHFTLLGKQPAYFVARSDDLGRFSVALPYREGNMELLVQAENKDKGPVEIHIDQDFDQRKLPVSAGPFYLSDMEERLLTSMARKVQLSGIYASSDTVGEKREAMEPVPFYGSPALSVNLDEFILLPTMKEVFISLVPGVTPVTRKNRYFLSIESINPAMSMFEPLIMIDEVPLFDMAKFLTVPTEKICRIDVIDDVYLKGDLRYGGVLNLHSRENDMAGIDLPDDAFFFDFQAMHPATRKEKLQVSEKDRMPDTRNTMLWKPWMQIKRNETIRISFVAPDYPGDYVLLFRGLDDRGKLIAAESVLTIK